VTTALSGLKFTVWSGVSHDEVDILTADVPLVSPGDPDHLLLNQGLTRYVIMMRFSPLHRGLFPVRYCTLYLNLNSNFSATQPDLTNGWHFNLFNNLWAVGAKVRRQPVPLH
jgi:hypothetical protein